METQDTGLGRPWRAATGTLLVAAVWALLAGRRPDTTYHFAPALVAWAYPYLRLSATPTGRRQALAAVAGGAAAAVIMTFALNALGWLEGPVLFGGDALGESLLVAGLAALAALGVSTVARRRE